MAILKDLIVSGVSRFVGRIFSSKINSNSFNNLLTGTGTAGQDKGSGVSNRYVPAKWVFDAGVTLEDGDIFTIKIPVSGHDYGVYMSINGGSNFYPVVRSGPDRLTTHFGSNSYITVVFDSSGSCGSIYSINGGNSRTTVSGGVFKVLNWYDSGNTYTSAYCSTSSSTAAKTASNSGYSLKNNSYLYIVITQSNTYAGAITLNVNGQGAKPIYINGEPSSSTNYTLPLGTYLAFYDGRAYYFDTNGDIPLKKYENLYLTFKALESGTFKFTSAINYSLDCGKTWVSLAANTNSPTITKGSTIMWKASLTPTEENGIGTFRSTGKFTVGGNAMSLLYGDNFVNQTSLSGKDWAFFNLFSSCKKITSAENMVLPATTLATNCYCYMFSECSRLTIAPELPATTLEYYCYQCMFLGCTSLITAPVLPATTLKNSCYYYMFDGCTSLRIVPSLPAKTLAEGCYSYMFSGCTSLTIAPQLPAKTLTNWCYSYMFYGCKSLTTAPELPATTLAQSCYSYMFKGCTLLTTAPELPATTLIKSCYNAMFQGCRNLNYIKAMFTTNPSITYMNSWVADVASSGTFVKNSAATWTSSCENSTYPCNWTVKTASS